MITVNDTFMPALAQWEYVHVNTWDSILDTMPMEDDLPSVDNSEYLCEVENVKNYLRDQALPQVISLQKGLEGQQGRVLKDIIAQWNNQIGPWFMKKNVSVGLIRKNWFPIERLSRLFLIKDSPIKIETAPISKIPTSDPLAVNLIIDRMLIAIENTGDTKLRAEYIEDRDAISITSDPSVTSRIINDMSLMEFVDAMPGYIWERSDNNTFLLKMGVLSPRTLKDYMSSFWPRWI